MVLDFGIGDIFSGRVAGNIADEDILGSMEFACKLTGAKVVLVMGHTACGAIKGVDTAARRHLRSACGVCERRRIGRGRPTVGL
jgi:carbonic anhydrase